MTKHVEDLRLARKNISTYNSPESNYEKEKHKKSLKILDGMIKNSKNIGKGVVLVFLKTSVFRTKFPKFKIG